MIYVNACGASPPEAGTSPLVSSSIKRDFNIFKMGMAIVREFGYHSFLVDDVMSLVRHAQHMKTPFLFVIAGLDPAIYDGIKASAFL
jgi:hypothetical protein